MPSIDKKQKYKNQKKYLRNPFLSLYRWLYKTFQFHKNILIPLFIHFCCGKGWLSYLHACMYLFFSKSTCEWRISEFFYLFFWNVFHKKFYQDYQNLFIWILSEFKFSALLLFSLWKFNYFINHDIFGLKKFLFAINSINLRLEFFKYPFLCESNKFSQIK